MLKKMHFLVREKEIFSRIYTHMKKLLKFMLELTQEKSRLRSLLPVEIQHSIFLRKSPRLYVPQRPVSALPLRFVADSKLFAFSSSFSSLLIFSRSSFSITAFDSSTSDKCSWVALLAEIKSESSLLCWG